MHIFRKYSKAIVCLLITSILSELIFPTAVYALTGGPSQPEVQSFEPIGTSEMVDPFSGDFNYNIPLIDVGGYPINLSYHSGVSMDQEASWVGLGWNINPGVINRNLRGIPDDFNGDQIQREFNIRPNVTVGVNASTRILGEFLGYDFTKNSALQLGVGLGLAFNNYNGVSVDLSVNPSISAAAGDKGTLTAGLGISSNTSSGIGITPSVSFSKKIDESALQEQVTTAKIGLPYNSRAGLQALTLNTERERNYIKSAGQSLKRVGGKAGEGTYKWVTNWETGSSKSLGSSSSSVSFASPTYTPKIDFPMLTQNLTVSFTLGSEIMGAHPNLNLQGYYSGQMLKDNDRSLPAYGYMNLQNGQSNKEAMLDFNREKDGGFTENTPALPLTGLTYDLYMVSGQGMGGSFRPHRSDVGYVFDPENGSTSIGLNVPSIELGMAVGAHMGVNFSANYSGTTTGLWEDNNPALTMLKYTKSEDGFYEPSYFKLMGEQTADDESNLYDSYGGADPVYIDFNRVGQAALPHMNDNTLQLPSLNHRQKRARRNVLLNPLNAEEATAASGSSLIEIYDPKTDLNVSNVDGYTIPNTLLYKNRYKPRVTIGRNDGSRPTHHMSQITTYRDDGAKYVYGIPAYNFNQQDVSFATNGERANCATGLVSYSPGLDNTRENKLGLDHFYERVKMPAYAHSYLLTSVLSADYIDLKGDGPSEDDHGTYTKINYFRALVNPDGDPKSPSNYLYQWRVPFEDSKANYNEGLKTLAQDDGDDKASYLYGTKELWYMHSIETKTHVAEFYTSRRKDGYGVKEEQGGLSDGVSNRMYKLDSIALYSREDKIKNGKNAVPIKSVHFVYDYSLCPNVSNNSGTTEIVNGVNINSARGKLTLKKIYFSYGKSIKSTLSPYIFTYSTQNPAYNIKGYDRWGNYKSNAGTTCGIYGKPAPAEYPYTDQERDANGSYLSDQYASAWALASIKLPSGGIINVEYEADDYAYVQNKKAMEMCRIVGTVDNTSISLSGITNSDLDANGNLTGKNQLFNTDGITDRHSFDYFIFKLDKPIADPGAAEYIRQNYLSDENGQYLKYLFFKFLVQLKKNEFKYEYVQGYAQLADESDRCGVVPNLRNNENQYTHGFVRIRREGNNFNPVSLASWNLMRRYLPKVAYNQPEFGAADLLNPALGVMKTILSTANSLYQIVRGGFDNSMSDFGNSSMYSADRSIIRLYNPSGMKKGGGSRVKKLTLNDRWQAMLANDARYENFDYGQEFSYTTADANGRTISSGVAAYEPILGGEENPFRQPVFFSEEKMLAPDETFYQEEPYGESYFPAPMVGYSKVTITNLKRTAVVTGTTGKTVMEFYTAKDFPTKADSRSSLIAARTKPALRAILSLLKTYSIDDMTASQGFVVEVNDMHGKPKSQWEYSELKPTPISGVEYKYSLTNNISSIDKGEMTGQFSGLDYDIVADFREQSSITASGGIGGNLDAFLAFILPMAIPMVLPDFSYERTRFRSATVTKVITHYSTLTETIAHDGSSEISTRNLYKDAETGNVLVQQSRNAFDDPLYSFTYPAHWAYDKMGLAYKNIGYKQTAERGFNLNQEINGQPVFVAGDEVILDRRMGMNRDLITAYVAENAQGKYLIGKRGYPVDLAAYKTSYIKIVASGRRNHAGIPIGTVVSLQHPMSFNPQTKRNELAFGKVISANAMDFADGSKFFCECALKPGTRFNPYNLGLKNIWHMNRQWTYLTEREQALLNDNIDVRKDGLYSDFVPFWQKNTITGFYTPASDPERWQNATEASFFNPMGNELQSKDVLGRYSSATYGYMDMLPIAVGVNTQYKELGFTGFEDYDYRRCNEGHFRFPAEGTASISEQASHTGKRSIKITPGGTTTMSRKITKTAVCTPDSCTKVTCND
jgi:hypothetical protein